MHASRSREGATHAHPADPRALAMAAEPSQKMGQCCRGKFHTLSAAPVPEVCLLDPDGDIVRFLRAGGRTRRVEGWACYHSEMDRFERGGREYGIIGCA